MTARKNSWHPRLPVALPVVVFAVLAYATTPADAQPAQSSTSSATTSADGQVGFQRSTKLTAAEQLTQADMIVTRLQATASTVAQQLGAARKSHDVVKTLCLNDKLSQIDVAVRSASDRKTSLQAAAARNDVELASHEFTIMTVLKQRADQLTAEANQCIGEEAAFIGETATTMIVDPSIPNVEEMDYPPTDPTLVSGPPLPTSADN